MSWRMKPAFAVFSHGKEQPYTPFRFLPDIIENNNIWIHIQNQPCADDGPNSNMDQNLQRERQSKAVHRDLPSFCMTARRMRLCTVGYNPEGVHPERVDIDVQISCERTIGSHVSTTHQQPSHALLSLFQYTEPRLHILTGLGAIPAVRRCRQEGSSASFVSGS